MRETLETLKHSIEELFIVYKLDLERKVIKCNQNFLKLTQLTQDEAHGLPIDEIRSPNTDDFFINNKWITVENGIIWEGDLCQMNKSGEEFWTHTYIIPNFDENGEHINYTVISSNITERKLKEIEHQREKESLIFTSQLAAIGEMTAGIAHEINNPLMIINGHAKKLEDQFKEAGDLNAIYSLEKIKASSLRVAKIVKGMEKLSRKTKEEDTFEEKGKLNVCKQRWKSRS